MNDHLRALESETIYIIREAFRLIQPVGMLWSMGKDSTALLWMVRKAFFGRVPFPVILLDTGMELPEVYEFRDYLIKEWDLDCLSWVCPDEDKMDATLPPATRCAARKTEGLKSLIAKYEYKGIILGIRRDEQALRSKERIFSPRTVDGTWNYIEQPVELWNQYRTGVGDGEHIRIHPILSWRELDIWKYIQNENIPCCSLYFAKDGLRYRSLGERNITHPIASEATTIDQIIEELKNTLVSERAGRSMDSETEDSFERLRVSGYM